MPPRQLFDTALPIFGSFIPEPITFFDKQEGVTGQSLRLEIMGDLLFTRLSVEYRQIAEWLLKQPNFPHVERVLLSALLRFAVPEVLLQITDALD